MYVSISNGKMPRGLTGQILGDLALIERVGADYRCLDDVQIWGPGCREAVGLGTRHVYLGG